MLFRRILLLATLLMPGGLLLVGAGWLVREIAVRERRQKWEKRLREWLTPPPGAWLPPSPQP